MKFLLYPFAILYHLLMSFRNHLYNIGYRKSIHFDSNVICVGNLTVGGTGKTPMVEYLISLLSDKYQVATLSRGYGRKTRGFKIADNADSAFSIGDEPFQMYKKFGHKITVAVGEERALAIPEILFNKPETEVIILDDAFQHRRVEADFNILLSDYNRPFYEDYILPVGLLRESRSGAGRANAVIVTKCPEKISLQEKKGIVSKIRKYAGEDKPVFFSSVKYMAPEYVFSHSQYKFSENILLFSGIADSRLLEEYVKNNYNLIKHIKFADHYNYSQKEIDKISSEFAAINKGDKCILTTEKDMVKLISSSMRPLVEKLPLFYLPVRSYFPEEGEKFDSLIKSLIKVRKAD